MSNHSDEINEIADQYTKRDSDTPAGGVLSILGLILHYSQIAALIWWIAGVFTTAYAFHIAFIAASGIQFFASYYFKKKALPKSKYLFVAGSALLVALIAAFAILNAIS